MNIKLKIGGREIDMDGVKESIWCQTVSLRRKVKLIRGIKETTLQQLWQSINGETEWRDVPTENEDESAERPS